MSGRRFTAVGREFAIVVLGVLVALAADSWWDRLQERETARDYLVQLVLDLEETKRAMSEADSVMLPGDQAGAALLRAFRSSQIPERDSIYAMVSPLGFWGDPPRRVLETFDALISTGEIEVIRPRSLRMEIVAYLNAARDAEAADVADRLAYRESLRDLFEEIDIVEAWAPLLTVDRQDPLSLLPPDADRTPFPLDEAAFMGSRRAYNALLFVTTMRLNERWRRSRTTAAGDELAALLTAALDER